MKSQQLIKNLVASKRAAREKVKAGCVPCFARVGCVPCLGRADDPAHSKPAAPMNGKN